MCEAFPVAQAALTVAADEINHRVYVFRGLGRGGLFALIEAQKFLDCEAVQLVASRLCLRCLPLKRGPCSGLRPLAASLVLGFLCSEYPVSELPGRDGIKFPGLDKGCNNLPHIGGVLPKSAA